MMQAFLTLAALSGGAPGGVADDCNRPRGDDIVVCGSRPGQSPYRLPKLPYRYDARRIRAETDAIPGVHTRAHVDTEARPDGYQDHRAMVTFSIPF